MKTSARTVIDQPAEKINLIQWLSTLSDLDYQACSRAHRAAGTFRQEGVLGMVNVESVGGNLLIQHYLAARAEPNHVVMRSANTRVYVNHLLPATIEVIWTVAVEPRDAGSAHFSCSVETRMPPILGILSTVALLPLFLGRHTREETQGFADDIARKLRDGRLG